MVHLPGCVTRALLRTSNWAEAYCHELSMSCHGVAVKEKNSLLVVSCSNSVYQRLDRAETI